MKPNIEIGSAGGYRFGTVLIAGIHPFFNLESTKIIEKSLRTVEIVLDNPSTITVPDKPGKEDGEGGRQSAFCRR